MHPASHQVSYLSNSRHYFNASPSPTPAMHINCSQIHCHQEECGLVSQVLCAVGIFFELTETLKEDWNRCLNLVQCFQYLLPRWPTLAAIVTEKKQGHYCVHLKNIGRISPFLPSFILFSLNLGKQKQWVLVLL